MRLVQRKLAQLIKNVDSKSWWVEGIADDIRAEYKGTGGRKDRLQLGYRHGADRQRPQVAWAA